MRNGPTPTPIPLAGPPRPLVREDLERLKQPRFIPTAPQKLRESHHMIARLSALGLRPFEIMQRTSYSRERITTLLASPAMVELVANYRAKVDERYVENVDSFFELATSNMIAAERHIADTIADLDEVGELLPVRTALAISRDAADRFGYGKHSTATNINVDFAAKLEAAIKRSGKGPAVIEASVAGPSPLQAQLSAVTHGVSSRKTQQPVAQPQPLVRRRA